MHAGGRRAAIAGPLMLVAFGLGAVVTVAAACGARPDGPPETRYPFTDDEGRKCSQARFGLTAQCDRDAAPSTPCNDASVACFVVLVPTLDGGGISGDLSVLQPNGSMWNCPACCNAGETRWTGLTNDCAPVVCKNHGDCAGEDGKCEDGRCISSRK